MFLTLEILLKDPEKGKILVIILETSANWRADRSLNARHVHFRQFA